MHSDRHHRGPRDPARPAIGQRNSALLRPCGRRNDPSLVEQLLTDLRAPALRQPEPVEHALGITVEGLVRIVVAMREVVDRLEAELAVAFDQHELRPDPALRPRTGPVTRASGRSRYVKARKIRNKRLADACHWWAFATLTRSPGARAHYDRRRSTSRRRPPQRHQKIDESGRRSAATLKQAAQNPPPTPPTGPRRRARRRSTEEEPGTDRAEQVLAQCGIADLAVHAEHCQTARRALGLSPTRRAAPRLLAAIQLALLRGWPPDQIKPALLAVADRRARIGRDRRRGCSSRQADDPAPPTVRKSARPLAAATLPAGMYLTQPAIRGRTSVASLVSGSA